MNIIADTHMHTVASTHAYSTVNEMVRAAAQKGLYAVAITDHGPGMPNAPGKWYFHNMRVIPHMLEGVLVLRGEETNVLDFDGNTDLNDSDLDILDWVVASIHKPLMKDKSVTVEAVTNAWLNIAKNPNINVIGHSGTMEFEYDYEKVIPEFGRCGKLVELNEGTFFGREKSIPNCVRIMQCCKKYGVPVIVDSDAHFYTQVGCFDNSLKLLKDIDFPEELVVNSDVSRFRAYLKQYSGVFGDPTLS